MRKLRRILYLALLGVLGAFVVLVNPYYVLLASIGLFALLTLSRQINLYKVAMMIKRLANNTSKLRIAIRAKVHTGFKDYTAIDNEEESRSKTCGYIR